MSSIRLQKFTGRIKLQLSGDTNNVQFVIPEFIRIIEKEFDHVNVLSHVISLSLIAIGSRSTPAGMRSNVLALIYSGHWMPEHSTALMHAT